MLIPELGILIRLSAPKGSMASGFENSQICSDRNARELSSGQIKSLW